MILENDDPVADDLYRYPLERDDCAVAKHPDDPGKSLIYVVDAADAPPRVVDAPAHITALLLQKDAPERNFLSHEVDRRRGCAQEILADAGRELCRYPPGNDDLENRAINDYAEQAVAADANYLATRVE